MRGRSRNLIQESSLWETPSESAADAMVLPENFDPKDITIEVADDGDLEL